MTDERYLLNPESTKGREIKSKNLLAHSDAIGDFFLESKNTNKEFLLTVELIDTIHSILMEDILKPEYMGFRIKGKLTVYIPLTEHKIPSPDAVSRHLEDMCDFINSYPNKTSNSFFLAAYAMWHINWIHPYYDGNGRTSRAISFLLLCIYSGIHFPDVLCGPQIPQRIYQNRDKYVACLCEADKALRDSTKIDVSCLESLIKTMLYEQKVDHDNNKS